MPKAVFHSWGQGVLGEGHNVAFYEVDGEVHTADWLEENGISTPETPTFKEWKQENYQRPVSMVEPKVDMKHLVDLWIEENAERIRIMGPDAAEKSWGIR